MCGIAGVLSQGGTGAAVDRGLLLRMSRALAHRGPDAAGIYLRGRIGLVHRRLSILDLSPAGHQPMANDDDSLLIVFNGEIYNFRELRSDLERDGCKFRSHTDTEVLLRLYERLGPACLERLRGMFAFAVWDARRQELFLARDRLGVKPLYFAHRPGRFTFASEVRALLQDPGIERRADPAAIHHYLSFQAVPSPLCAFAGVQKLPAAHYMIVRGAEPELHRYWRLRYRPKLAAATRAGVLAIEEELRARFEEAVRYRLVSDVPLGAFLSGGIDSSAVVAVMSRLSSLPVRTFSIGFEEHAYDELPAARAVARRFGTQHVEFRVRTDVLALLPALVRAYGEPFADASAIPTYVLARLARQHVTVALNGDGGDESFAGYDRYVANALAARLGGLARLVGGRVAGRLVRALPHGLGPRDTGWRLKRFLDRLGQTPEERNAGWMMQLDGPEKSRLYSPAFASQVGALDSRELVVARLREAEADDFLDACLSTDVVTYLPDTLLVKADIATMAHALEARSPFLDHVLMEFAARIPPRLKLRGRTTKWIFKQALSDELEPATRRRAKMGFNPPVALWLRGVLREPAYDLLLGERARARGTFEPRALERLLDEHWSGRWNWSTQIWTLMMLELWHREFLDRAPEPDPVEAEPVAAA